MPDPLVVLAWTDGAAGDIYRIVPLIILFTFVYLYIKLGLSRLQT